MNVKKPIDIIREQGGNTQIGTEEDGAIEEMLNVGERLLVIKERTVYEMKMADDIDPERTNPNIPNPKASPAGSTTYTVEISLLDSKGDTCKTSLKTNVNVFNTSILQLVASSEKDTILLGESVLLHASPTLTDYSISWFPPQTLNGSNTANPLANPVNTTSYSVIAYDKNGCSNSDTVEVAVISRLCDDSNIYIPNAFTPNGDGNNDVLLVRSNELMEVYFAVYNQWGELMFETKDQNMGWDGNYKSVKSNPGVFAYYLKAKCYNKKEFFKKGNVTLIR